MELRPSNKAYNACVEWEDRATALVDEEELSIAAMKIYLAAMEEDDGVVEQLPGSL